VVATRQSSDFPSTPTSGRLALSPSSGSSGLLSGPCALAYGDEGSQMKVSRWRARHGHRSRTADRLPSGGSVIPSLQPPLRMANGATVVQWIMTSLSGKRNTKLPLAHAVPSCQRPCCQDGFNERSVLMPVFLSMPNFAVPSFVPTQSQTRFGPWEWSERDRDRLLRAPTENELSASRPGPLVPQ
jgi:hypothetical protein